MSNMNQTTQDDPAKLLQTHRTEGESQTVEFKEQIPSSVRDLAEVIASFATSNTGSIYIGIDNSGTIVGINALNDGNSKDEFQKRILGIGKSVNPSIRVSVDFIETESKVIARIIVPNGIEPVYYVGGIPYLRDLSSSRKANPSEVKELHMNYFQTQGTQTVDDSTQQFVTDAVVNLCDAQLAISDMNDHHVNPSLDQLKYDLGSRGQILFDASADSVASELGISDQLKTIGQKLIEIEKYRFYLGKESWEQFLKLGNDASELIEQILPSLQKQIHSDENSKKYLAKLVSKNVTALKNEWEQAQEFKFGSEYDALQDTFRNLAYNFYRFANMPDAEQIGVHTPLIELAKTLRSLTTPKAFGFRANGFDPIASNKSEVEKCISIAEDIQKRFQDVLSSNK